MPEHPQVLAYVREWQGERMLCVFNFSEQRVQYELPTDWSSSDLIDGTGSTSVEKHNASLNMQPWAWAFLAV
jgi:glycosidase